MSEDLMKGYTRNVDMMGKLLSSLVKAMTAHPSLRLGQLLYAVIAKHYKQDLKDIGDTLFQIYDEELCKALEAFAND